MFIYDAYNVRATVHRKGDNNMIKMFVSDIDWYNDATRGFN